MSFIDVCSGALDSRQKIPLAPGYQVPFSVRTRTQAEIATWAVAMITRARQAEEIIAGGIADIVALAGGMMFNPRWVCTRPRNLALRQNIKECTHAARLRNGP